MSSWTEPDRQYLAELCREHDRMMAEHAASEWARERAADDELVFKTMEDVTPPAPKPKPEPFDQLQTYVLVQLIVELRKEWRQKRDEAIAPLKAEIAELKGRLDAVAELKGKVDALLTLFQGAKAEVIGLPRKRPSDAA